MTKKTRPFAQPGFTMFDNVIIDYIMPDLSPNGWKVLCVAIRQTIGWVDKSSPTGRKEKDYISYSQFMEKTGIKSTATLWRAIGENLEKGYLLRERSQDHIQGFDYRLNQDYETTLENEEVLDETALETKAVLPETTLETKDTKERGKKESKETSSAVAKIIAQAEGHPDQFDLSLGTLKAREREGQWTTPKNGLIGVAIKRIYERLGSDPPKQDSGTWVKLANMLEPVLADHGVRDVKTIKAGVDRFHADSPKTFNPWYQSFPGQLGIYLGKSEEDNVIRLGH